MKTLTEQFEEIVQAYIFPEDGKERYGCDSYIDALIQAVKERDEYILGEEEGRRKPAGGVGVFADSEQSIRNELRKEQMERAEESL